jgi:hypothetical protein
MSKGGRSQEKNGDSSESTGGWHVGEGRVSQSTTVFDRYDPETDTYHGSIGGFAGNTPFSQSGSDVSQEFKNAWNQSQASPKDFWTTFSDAPKAPSQVTQDSVRWTNPITGKEEYGSSSIKSYQDRLKGYLDANPGARESYLLDQEKKDDSLRSRIERSSRIADRGTAGPLKLSPASSQAPPIEEFGEHIPDYMQPTQFGPGKGRRPSGPGKGRQPSPYYGGGFGAGFGGGFGGYQSSPYGGGYGGGFGGYQPSPYGGGFNQGYGVPRGIGSLLSSYPPYMPPRMPVNPYFRG